jgi:hypothetical protein
MQGGDARIDQALALPAMGISGAGDTRRLWGFSLEATHVSA